MTIADAQQHCVAVIKQEKGDEDDDDNGDDQDIDCENNVNDSSYGRYASTGSESGSAPKSGPAAMTTSSSSTSSSMQAAKAAAAAAAVAFHHQQATEQHLQLTSRLFNACNAKAAALNAAAANNVNNLNNVGPGNNGTGLNNNNNNSGAAGSNGGTSTNFLLPCPLCDVPLEPRVFRQHLDRHYPRDSPICPVMQCGRRFAHPNSVRNHLRLKHFMQWSKMKAMRSSGGPFSGIP